MTVLMVGDVVGGPGRRILRRELKGLKARALEAGYRITVTPAAKRFVADAGYELTGIQ